MLGGVIDTWSIAIASASFFASVVGFSILRLLELRRAREETRRMAILGVLGAVERASRVLSTSSVSGIWTNHVFELVQVMPRLMVGLHRKDEPIARWVFGEVQSLIDSRRRRDALRVIQGVGFTLGDWHAGRKSRAWFVNEVSKETPVIAAGSLRRFRLRNLAAPLLTMIALPAHFGFAFGIGFRALDPRRTSGHTGITKVRS